jgi:hypothetical protein
MYHGRKQVSTNSGLFNNMNCESQQIVILKLQPSPAAFQTNGEYGA